MNERSAAQSLASLAGTAFLVVGILGFVPGVTEEFHRLRFAGHRSAAELFGIYDISILHNLLHLALGVAGLWLARTFTGARAYLVGAGALYVVLGVYGLAVSRASDANFIPVDAADDWTHLAVGVALIAAGIVAARARPARAVALGP